MDRVFVIDNEPSVYSDVIQKRGLDVFGTKNIYDLVRYAQELNPALYVVDSELKDTNYANMVDYLVENHYVDEAPLVVLHKKGKEKKVLRPGVSHCLAKSDATLKLPEIADAYCLGGKKYDFLVIEDIAFGNSKSPGNEERLPTSSFNVYNERAAQIFMQKNKVGAVAVCGSPEYYNRICSFLDCDKIFYVKNTENLKDLVAFIK